MKNLKKSGFSNPINFVFIFLEKISNFVLSFAEFFTNLFFPVLVLDFHDFFEPCMNIVKIPKKFSFFSFQIVKKNEEFAVCRGRMTAPNIAFYKGKPILVCYEDGFRVRYIRFFFDLKSFFRECEEYRFEKNKNTEEGEDWFAIRRDFDYLIPESFEFGTTDDSESVLSVKVSNSVNIFKEPILDGEFDYSKFKSDKAEAEDISKFLFYDDDKKDIIEEVEHWFHNADKYLNRGIPYRRGMIFYGPPGTGKTSFVKVLQNKFNLPLYSVNLAMCEMEDLEIITERTDRYRIVLFEDIDSSMSGRKLKRETSQSLIIQGEGGSTKRRSKKTSANFSHILGLIDKCADGTLLIMTTNKIEEIDPALGTVGEDGRKMTRPGRIDSLYEFGNIRKEEKIRIANFILSGLPSNIIDEAISEEGEMSAASFKEICWKKFLKYESGGYDDKKE